ncbi:LexA family transcriptional regulator [Prevotella sp.]|uniref:LexA family transcriptional regulator n=1 Tax=Prevotella sp. TaxID=59823 RepID=UPI0040276A94
MDKTKMLEGLIRHYTKGNKAQFAKLLGVSAQTISAWIARNTFDAELIYAKCRYVDSSWLLTGEGAMLQETENNNAPTSKHTVEIAHQVPHGSSEGIPLIPLDAVAGFPAESGGGVRLEDCERYVIPEFENKGANFLIRVSGDSMVPLYYSGDLLACRKITDIRFFQWGTVYVLETSQGVLVKRVQESVDHADSILCVSENNSVHHPFLLPRDDIRSLSTIVGLVRLV